MVTFHTLERLDVCIMGGVLLPILLELLSGTLRNGQFRLRILLHQRDTQLKPGVQSGSGHRESWGDSDSAQFG